MLFGGLTGDSAKPGLYGLDCGLDYMGSARMRYPCPVTQPDVLIINRASSYATGTELTEQMMLFHY